MAGAATNGAQPSHVEVLREKLGEHLPEGECPGCFLGDDGPEAHDCGLAGMLVYEVPGGGEV